MGQVTYHRVRIKDIWGQTETINNVTRLDTQGYGSAEGSLILCFENGSQIIFILRHIVCYSISKIM